ncbi:MaoC family dehydratase [Natrialbaceae archaeon A-CW2]|uniref:MaoC family dehydratase n=1 Tax=Natronosalvus amylolyticus TaxID=2961994 RepID=UPI0020C9BBE4|nr:MaoC family dehydratase [Natronosalvus amylolyticus]
MELSSLEPGDELPPVTVEDLQGSDMKLGAALLQDPYPPHFDERTAEEMGYPRLLNQGPFNLSYLLQCALQPAASPTALESFDTRFHAMVFEGDTVTASATVDSVRAGETDGAPEAVTFTLELTREDGTVAVDGTATVRVSDE